MPQYKYAEDPDEIQDGDYVISSVASPQGWIDVGTHNEDYFGEFQDLDLALEFIISRINRTKYFPNIFYINDHGNVDQIVLEGVEI
jgi:hypothetical protein